MGQAGQEVPCQDWVRWDSNLSASECAEEIAQLHSKAAEPKWPDYLHTITVLLIYDGMPHVLAFEKQEVPGQYGPKQACTHHPQVLAAASHFGLGRRSRNGPSGMT